MRGQPVGVGHVPFCGQELDWAELQPGGKGEAYAVIRLLLSKRSLLAVL